MNPQGGGEGGSSAFLYMSLDGRYGATTDYTLLKISNSCPLWSYPSLLGSVNENVLDVRHWASPHEIMTFPEDISIELVLICMKTRTLLVIFICPMTNRYHILAITTKVYHVYGYLITYRTPLDCIVSTCLHCSQLLP